MPDSDILTWQTFHDVTQGFRRPFALELYQALSSWRLRVWIDNLPDGEGQMGLRLKESMRRGIMRSSVAVVLLSPDYARSPNCIFELRTIRELQKPFVVCSVEPGFWRNWARDAPASLFACGQRRVVRLVPDDHEVVSLANLSENHLFVDLGNIAALPWTMPDGLEVQPASLREALHSQAHALPQLIRMIDEAKRYVEIAAPPDSVDPQVASNAAAISRSMSQSALSRAPLFSSRSARVAPI